MRVFVTGATGFIGTAVVKELIDHGHEVLGLTRSDTGAQALEAAGAQPHRGDLEDLDSLRRGAGQADGVIHCAFDHDFSNFAANCEKDKRAIEALGSALRGTARPIVITSGTGMGSPAPGLLAKEDVFDAGNPNPRKLSELTGAALAEDGVNVSIMRLPQVHDTTRQGLLTYAVSIARDKGVSAYIGEGLNRYAAAHVLDVARLYRLAIERQQPNARYHAVAEEGVPLRDIAEVIGRVLGVPTASIAPQAAVEHFGWMSMFAGMDLPASSAWTQATLGWHPTGPGLLADLRNLRLATA
ncbi:SDR family oxidoreductase [Achromobacter aloeverae]|uniref:NAD-dependent dehydratase n=1 Tax=Achromobacter aloeverae TaxID=1750518 RepID=A0A4Q1HMR5_9BURK|nr:SDR family oxidoreductase [Achromobacter aloeverae]RXN91232.1 NAD-dependent dehydratase [Achromobacter aloeverae]